MSFTTISEHCAAHFDPKLAICLHNDFFRELKGYRRPMMGVTVDKNVQFWHFTHVFGRMVSMKVNKMGRVQLICFQVKEKYRSGNFHLSK